MSLILEALRKSEAERRRGQVPDLHAEPAPGVRRMREGPPAWLWLALAFATALVLTIALWLARSLPSMPARAADRPAATVATPAGSAATRPGLDARPVEGAALSASPDRPEGVDRAAKVTPPSARESGVAPLPHTASPTLAMTATAAPPDRASAPTRAVVAPAAAAAPVRAPADPIPAPEPAVAPTPAAVVANATMPTAVATSSDAAPPAPPASGSPPLRLSDLTVAQRRQLPPLKMSMHLWAPTQRFAIIDGTRVSEGDRIGDAVVEEITASGVVLAWQGQRLQIPTR